MSRTWDMKTDSTQQGLESRMIQSQVKEAGYVQGESQDYDREHAVDLAKRLQFLTSTQFDTYFPGRERLAPALTA
jgi:type I restriction enzyme, R subunit